MDGWLVVLIPLGTAFLGAGLAAILTRRTGKESNTTTAFDVAAKSLLATNEGLRQDIVQLRADVNTLKQERAAMQTENQNLRTRVTHLEDELEKVREGNRLLADSVGKLIEAWPAGTAMPALDPNWQRFKR
jgi:chromosome segregation ATPase